MNTFTFDISLDDLYHGIQGRSKDLEHLVTEFELFQILAFPKLTELVVSVKCNGISLTPGAVSLLAELEEWLKEGVRGEVGFIHMV